MTYALTAIDYKVERHRPVIYLFTRDECKNRKVFKVNNVKPYYYYKDPFGEHPVRAIDGSFVTKKETRLPSDVGRERERHSITYESDILFPIRFMVDRGIRYGLDVEEGKVTAAEFKGGVVLPLFLDVEVEVDDVNIFPDPRKAKWMIIAATIWCPIDGNIAAWQFSINDEQEEREFLEFFIKIVEEFDPDIITAYNVFFDICTIINRMKHYAVPDYKLSPLGRVRIDERWDRVNIAGRNVFDYYEAYKKYKHRTLPSYELESIAEDEVGFPRSDFPLENMNRQFLADVTDYNLKDVARMMCVEWKQEILDFYDNIRITVGCTFDEVLEASRYVDILLLRYAKGKYVLPRKATKSVKQKYEGALVLPPEKGIHFNVAMLDFTKMYPSILISYNISPETLRLEEPEAPHYTVPVGYKYEDEEGNEYTEWKDVYYLKSPRGMAPQIAIDLIQLRDACRDDMFKHSPGSLEYIRLWHRQDALKVVVDAMYGVFAYPPFRLYVPEISASMTGQGQKLIKRTIELVEGKGYSVLYGDSVTGDCPVITHDDEGIDIVPIEELQPGVEVWTKNGWNIPSHIIKKPCKKQLYEVITPAGIVKCTEDHSLFKHNGKLVKPAQLSENDMLLLNAYPKPKKATSAINETEAWLIGLFTADGSNMGGGSSSYSILTKHRDEATHILKQLQCLNIRGAIKDYRKSSNVFAIKIYKSYIWELCDQTYSQKRHRKVPKFILNAPTNIQLAFLRGYFRGDGTTYPKKQGYKYEFVSLTSKSVPLLIGISFMLHHLTGQTHNIIPHRTAYHMWLRSSTPNKKKQLPNGKIKLVRPILPTNYVYDLETPDSSFCIGRIVVHNTDSLYFSVGDNPIPKGERLRDEVNAFWEEEKTTYGLYIAPSVKLEYVFEWLVLAKKKRYAARVIYDTGKPADELKIIGFETRRSDSALFSQRLQRNLFKLMDSYADNEKVLNFIVSEANKLKLAPLSDIGVPQPLKTPIKAMKNVARVKSIVYANQYLNQKLDTGSHPLEYYIKTERLAGDVKKEFGFRDKPILPDNLPPKFSLRTWSPKAGQYVINEYIADRIAFGSTPPEKWREYIDMDTMVEKVVWNKVETILAALGVSEEDRIKLYGSKRPIKKEKEV